MFEELLDLTSTFSSIFRKIAKNKKISLSQAFILLLIDSQGSSMSRLAYQIGLDNSTMTRNIEKLEKAGILAFEDPAETIWALNALARLNAGFQKKIPARPKIPTATPKVPTKALNEYEAKRLMKKAGIPTGRESLVKSPADAAKAAARIGFPVVMKIVSPDILHKTEIGGVVLNLNSQSAVRKAFNDIMANAKKAEPDARIDGVLVAKMIGGGVETILGTFRDPAFGPVVMFGLGGIFAEDPCASGWPSGR